MWPNPSLKAPTQATAGSVSLACGPAGIITAPGLTLPTSVVGFSSNVRHHRQHPAMFPARTKQHATPRLLSPCALELRTYDHHRRASPFGFSALVTLRGRCSREFFSFERDWDRFGMDGTFLFETVHIYLLVSGSVVIEATPVAICLGRNARG